MSVKTANIPVLQTPLPGWHPRHWQTAYPSQLQGALLRPVHSAPPLARCYPWLICDHGRPAARHSARQPPTERRRRATLRTLTCLCTGNDKRCGILPLPTATAPLVTPHQVAPFHPHPPHRVRAGHASAAI